MRINAPLLLLLLFLLSSACTTQRKRDAELRGLSKFWHDTNAKYNGYFNAREILQNTYASLDNGYQDHYNEILPVYPFKQAGDVQAVTPQLNTAIEKVSVVVNLHRKSQWVDDCYLLIGQAQYLQRDYESAEATLRYALDEYGPDDLARREANAKRSKKRRKKSSAGKRKTKTDRPDKSEREREAKHKSPKDIARERKAAIKERERYNRELKKRKKQAARSKKKKRSGKKKNTPSPVQEKPASTEEPKEATEPSKEVVAVPPGEAPVPTRIRLTQTGNPLDVGGNPDSYFMKHRPAYQHARLWLAHVLIDRDNFSGASGLMSQLENNPKTFDEVHRELAPLQAHYYIQQHQYGPAADYLERAVELEKNREKRARYAFILGQLSQKLGQGKRAYIAFEQAEKWSQSYDMIFNSRLSMAQNGWLAGTGSAEDTRRKLEKMIEDPKNTNYLDRIYYTLAQIDLKDGKTDQAIAHLEKSIEVNADNSSQRGDSYVQLSELYYQAQNYQKAKQNMDLALGLLTKVDHRRPRLEKFSSSLKEIVEKEVFIEEQDSLLSIAAMSEEDRKALAYKMQQEQVETARNAARTDSEKSTRGGTFGNKNVQGQAGLRTPNPGPATRPTVTTSSFFAYNDRSVKRGKREFEREWGERPLVDNWRRKAEIQNVSIASVSEEPEIAPVQLSEEEVANVLVGVPKNDEEIAVMQLKLAQAMYQLGVLYRDRLEDNDKTVEILERMDRHYPGGNDEMEAWYYLYLAHTDLGNTSSANTYKQKLLDRYPNSMFAQLLRDPNNASLFATEHQKLERGFDAAYAALKAGNYQQAYDLSAETSRKHGADNELQPKLELVRAMASGNLEGREAYINNLRQLVVKWPDTDEASQAEEMLRVLGAKSAALPGQNTNRKANKSSEDATSRFKAEPDKLHYALIHIKSKDAPINDISVSISDYHGKYHKLERLRSSPIKLGTDDNVMMIIRKFKNQEVAMKYYEGVLKYKDEYIDAAYPFDIYMVSQGNYRTILKARSLEGYQAFFESNY